MKNFFDLEEVLLILIILIAFFLRFWNLANVPPSASLDEASIGYNAYSILKIGVDEYGKFPLISQRGYDDYRRSTYLMLVIPSVALFGLNVLSIRLPAIILSILTVLATYYIVLSLFFKRSSFALYTALLTSFLLAISPWHIYISRLGHESNACLSFLVFGVLFFLQGQKRKNWVLILISMIFFTLSMISYYSGQVFIPLFVGGLFIVFRKDLLGMVKLNKKILIPFSVFFIFLVPVFWSIFSPQSLIRFQGTSTFTPDAHWSQFQQMVLLRNKAVTDNNFIGMVIYNRRLYPIYVLVQGYFAHFSPAWLFSNFSSQPFKAPNMGLLYIWEMPLILIGILFIIFAHNLDLKIKIIIFLWFFLGPLPASIATQTPHAMRSYNFLPMWQIFSAFGLLNIFFIFRKFRIWFFLMFTILIIVSICTFYKNYFILFPKEQSNSFQYGLSKAIPYVLSKKNNYQKIIFSNKDNAYQSYMFYLFYSKYDPRKYQKEGGTKSGGFQETHEFENLEFRPITKQLLLTKNKTLFIGNISEFPIGTHFIKKYSNLDGKIAIMVTEKL